MPSPSCFHNRDRCSAVTDETSALNCSANSATTASASDSGSPTSTLAGNGGNDIVCAHTRRTSAAQATVARAQRHQPRELIFPNRNRSRHSHTLERTLPAAMVYWAWLTEDI